MMETESDAADAATAAVIVDQKNARKKCFSSVQLRRVWAPLSESTVALCPSMDLVTFSLQQGQGGGGHQQQPQQTQHGSALLSSASPLWLHRTLTFQKLATITVDETTTTTATSTAGTLGNNSGMISNNDTPQQQIQAAVWRPDGRWLAIVTHDPTAVVGGCGLYLTLFHVEEMVSSGTLSTGNIDPIPQMAANSSSSGGAAAGAATGGGALSLSEANFPQLIGMSGNLIRIPISSSSSTMSSSAAVAAAAASADASADTAVSSSSLTTARQVLGISWAHVGRWHPDLEDRDEEETMEHFYWKFRSRYVDRAAALLPPSDYHREHYGGLGGAAAAAASSSGGGGLGSSQAATRQHHQTSHGGGDGVLPNSNTPLSLLAVATDKGTVDCFLHGRYLIARDLPFDLIPGSSSSNGGAGRVTMVSSNDLVHLVLHSQGSPKISLYSLPAIGREHYNLQTITALYASIMGHLYALPSSITQVAESWKSSLKPLDRMIEGLVRLLQNYGLISSSAISDTGADTYREQSAIRAHFVQYILSGHTMRAADLSNAMDQFFTGVQMNDQLLTRMERSLTVAVANVESLLRKAVAAGQALVLETTELVGIGRFAPNLLEPASAQRLQEYAQVLFVTLESALTCIIDARFRLRDFVAWLRATGSQIKARGTAVNSVQRENARKRRVPDSTVQRILRYLQGTEEGHGGDDDNYYFSFALSKKNLSEALLGLNLTEHWETSFSALDGSPPTVKLGRPSSPRSVSSASAATVSCAKSIPTIPFALSKTVEAAHILFDHPRAYISKSFRRTDLCLPMGHNNNINADKDVSLPVALTTRLGAGGLSEEGLAYGEEPPTGFFAPKMVDTAQQRDSRTDRQWALVAQTMDHPQQQQQQEVAGGSVVCMYALPIPARGASTLDYDDDDDDDDYSNAENDDQHSFVLSTTFSFPAGYRVCDLAFYGDNGKSSLFSGVDGGCGKERRQALGALVVCPPKKDIASTLPSPAADSASASTAAVTLENDASYGLEVWLIDYERSTWTDYDLEKQYDSNKKNIDANATTMYALPPLCESSKIHKAVPMTRGRDGEEGSNNNENDAENMQDENNNSNNNKEQRVLYARTREIGRVDALAVATSSRFIVSGSRGMGVVLTNQPGGTLLEVLDMEEDEEVDDDDDDDEDDNEDDAQDDEGDEQMQDDDGDEQETAE